MSRFIPRTCVFALLSTMAVLAGCERDPVSENGDRHFVFEPTQVSSPTSYYKGVHGEFVTYGLVRPNVTSGSLEYEHTGFRTFGSRGSMTLTKEEGGFLVVFDTKDQPISLAYRVREDATTARVQVYVIDEATGYGVALGDTVVARSGRAGFVHLASNGANRRASLASDGLVNSACDVTEMPGRIADALSYAGAAGTIVTGLVIGGTGGTILIAFGGLLALNTLYDAVFIPGPDSFGAITTPAIDEATRESCPDEYGDRQADCPRCNEPTLTCRIDVESRTPISCCESGDCEKDEPEDEAPPCASCGDVHVRTPDGLAYDFQGAGEYLLMASSDGSVVVQSRQEPWRGSDRATVNTATAMNVAGDRVGIYLDRSPQLYVNGTPTPFSGGRIDLPNGGAVLDAEPGYLVRWPGGFVVSVRPRASFLDIGMSRPEGSALSYAGLLGNMNGDPADDFFTRGGQGLTLPVEFDEMYGVFGASWQISQSESLFDYQGGESTATYALPDFPTAPVTVDDLDPEAYRAAREACLGISDPVLLNDCILDVALTGESGFINSAKNAPAPERTLDVNYPDGLVGAYYDGYFEDDLSFFARNAPLLTRVDNPVDFRDDAASWDLAHVPALADLETYSVVWEGRLIVPRPGTYTLYLNSDDASYLFLGDATRNPSTSNATINNGQLHPVREHSVQVQLQAGSYPLILVYGEAGQNNLVQFSWSSDELGIPREIVTALGRRAGP